LATAWQLLGLQALVGVTLGGISPMLSSLLATYTEPGEAGAAYGLDNSVNAGSRTVAPMLGAVVAASYGLRATFVATGLLFLASTIIATRLLPKPGSLVTLEEGGPGEDGG
jgi:MFS transporter, DHA1 family, multidrug resistance protein